MTLEINEVRYADAKGRCAIVIAIDDGCISVAAETMIARPKVRTGINIPLSAVKNKDFSGCSS